MCHRSAVSETIFENVSFSVIVRHGAKGKKRLLQNLSGQVSRVNHLLFSTVVGGTCPGFFSNSSIGKYPTDSGFFLSAIESRLSQVI